MPIIDLQKRARELGRIRIGQIVEAKGKGGKTTTRPAKLDRFRLTSASKPLLDKVAAAYGGQVSEWTPANGGAQQWEVLTDADRLPVLVPPQSVSQWWELWSGGGCQRRCDGSTEVLSDSPCLCAAAEERVCKPTTRLNVVLRDIEGLGVWRLESHGFNAAVELPQVAEFLAQAGEYVSAWLGLEERTVIRENAKGEPETRRFMVPVLEVDITPAQLMAGGASGGAAQVAGGAQPRAALEQGNGSDRDWAAEAAAASSVEELRELWRQASATRRFTQAQMTAIMQPHLERLGGNGNGGESSGAGGGEAGQQTPPAAAGAPAPAQDQDPDQVWQAVLAEAGRLGMDLPTVESDFAKRNGGVTPETASAGELAAYLETLRSLNEYMEAQS